MDNKLTTSRKYHWLKIFIFLTFEILLSETFCKGAVLIEKELFSNNSKKNLKIISLNVNKITIGDSHLIISPTGKTMLIDTGFSDGYTEPSWGTGTVQKGDVLTLLKELKIEKIDWLVITHPHLDHIEAVPKIISNYKVKNVLWSSIPAENIKIEMKESADGIFKVISEIKTICAKKNIPIIEVKLGQKINFGDGVDCEVLAAAGAVKSLTNNYINNNSICMRIIYKSFSMMFTGDAGFEEEEFIIKHHRDLCSDILKVGHHGGAGSTSNEWIKAVSPKVSILPMPKWLSEDPRGIIVYKQLEENSIRIYRTWEFGNIMIKTDGNLLCVVTEKQIPTPK